MSAAEGDPCRRWAAPRKPPPSAEIWPPAVLFDLDGTLLDSAPDLHEALNETLGKRLEPFSLEEVKRLIGGGVPKLIERAFSARDKPLQADDRDRIAARFLAAYEPRATQLTRLRSGAAERVAAIAASGRRVGVVTNKPTAPTKALLTHFELLARMDVVVGGDAGPPVKPAPDLLLAACAQLGIAPHDAVFVGDSPADAGASKAAGMIYVLLRGGYTTEPIESLGAAMVVDGPADLTEEALRALREPAAS